MNTLTPIAGPADAGDLGYDEFYPEFQSLRAADLYEEHDDAPRGEDIARPGASRAAFEYGGDYVAAPYEMGRLFRSSNAYRRQEYTTEPGAITSLEGFAATVIAAVEANHSETARHVQILIEDTTGERFYRTLSLYEPEFGLRLIAPELAERIAKMITHGSSTGSDIDMDYFYPLSDVFYIGFVPLPAGGNETSTGSGHNFTWYRAFSFKCPEGDCLLAVARKVATIKPLNAAGKLMRNNCLRKSLGIAPGPIAATPDNLERISQAFGVGLTVYGPEPHIRREFDDRGTTNICRTVVEPDVIAAGGALLPKQRRVLLHADHYYLITDDMAPTICPITGDVNTPRAPAELRARVIEQGRPWRGRNFPEKKRRVRTYKDRVCVLDFETTWNPATARIEPYRAGFFLFDEADYPGGDFRPVLDREGVEILTGPSCARDFVELLLTRPEYDAYRIKIVTYNGARFDHYLLAEAAASFNELSKVFTTGNSIRSLNIGRHTTLDLCKLVQGSLASACASWKTLPAKLDTSRVSELVPFVFTHGDIQAARIAGTFDQWMAAHGADLDRYLRYDVLSTASLYMKVLPALTAVTGIEVGDSKTSTVAGASYAGWLAHLKRHEIPVPPACATLEEDEFMRKAMTGGRVQVFHPETPYVEADMRMVDVVSLYPTIMSAQNAPLVDARAPQLLWAQFPTGAPVATEVYRPGCVGIYRVTVVRQDPAKAVLPCKDAGDSLDWRHPGGFVTHATHCDIELIRLAGGQVEVHEGYYWPTARRDLFGSYLAGVMAEKNRQDGLKEAGSPDYNPAQREACKLVMNSLSGKVGQRNFESHAEIARGNADRQKAIERDKFRGGKADWVVLGAEACLLIGLKPEDRVYDPARAKPAYLSSFIYSYSRAYMWLFVIRDYDVLYMDTDSALLRVAEYDRLRAALPELDPDRHGGKALGDLEAENDKVYGESRAYLLAPKLYAIFGQGRKKAKAKGVSDRDLVLRDPSTLREVFGRVSTAERGGIDAVRAFQTYEGDGDRSGLVSFRADPEALFGSLLRHGRAVALSSAMVRLSPTTTAATEVGTAPAGDAFAMSQRYLFKGLVLPRLAGGRYAGLNWARDGAAVEPTWVERENAEAE